MDPCMLDDGLDPPHMDTGPLPSAKLGLMGAERKQSPSLFSGQDTESSFCRFIMCSHRRSCQCVRNLCETNEAGIFFSFHADYTGSNLTLWYDNIFYRKLDWT